MSDTEEVAGEEVQYVFILILLYFQIVMKNNVNIVLDVPNDLFILLLFFLSILLFFWREEEGKTVASVFIYCIFEFHLI